MNNIELTEEESKEMLGYCGYEDFNNNDKLGFIEDINQLLKDRAERFEKIGYEKGKEDERNRINRVLVLAGSDLRFN